MTRLDSKLNVFARSRASFRDLVWVRSTRKHLKSAVTAVYRAVEDTLHLSGNATNQELAMFFYSGQWCGGDFPILADALRRS